jgi:hypothetical protein
MSAKHSFSKRGTTKYGTPTEILKRKETGRKSITKISEAFGGKLTTQAMGLRVTRAFG